jgi:hypothetical protein
MTLAALGSRFALVRVGAIFANDRLRSLACLK